MLLVGWSLLLGALRFLEGAGEEVDLVGGGLELGFGLLECFLKFLKGLGDMDPGFGLPLLGLQVNLKELGTIGAAVEFSIVALDDHEDTRGLWAEVCLSGFDPTLDPINGAGGNDAGAVPNKFLSLLADLGGDFSLGEFNIGHDLKGLGGGIFLFHGTCDFKVFVKILGTFPNFLVPKGHNQGPQGYGY